MYHVECPTCLEELIYSVYTIGMLNYSVLFTGALIHTAQSVGHVNKAIYYALHCLVIHW